MNNIQQIPQIQNNKYKSYNQDFGNMNINNTNPSFQQEKNPSFNNNKTSMENCVCSDIIVGKEKCVHNIKCFVLQTYIHIVDGRHFRCDHVSGYVE